MRGLILLVAQGFGSGRVPGAPGTFGTAVGFLWLALLLVPGNLWIFLAGTLAGACASVWFCGAAERLLSQRDPGSVVLDEIIAVPICFTGWVVLETMRHGHAPAPGYFFTPPALGLTVFVFGAFRLFDIAKPWPIRQSQSLPGGWGVTIDDVLAAVYVNVVLALGYVGFSIIQRAGR